MRKTPRARLLALLTVSAILFALSSTVITAKTSQDETPVFRFHMQHEPVSLDPTRLQSTDASYFFNTLMRGLYSYSNEKGLVPENARRCDFETPLKLVCTIASTAKWSDGSRVEAGDYVRSFRRLLQTTSKTPTVELLKNVKNAMAAHAGRMPQESIGISNVGPDRLVIEFEKPDPDFLYKLTTSALVPIKSEKFPPREKASEAIVNGPYRIVNWQVGRRVRFESNPHYNRGAAKRPPVEILFVDDDETAFNLYKSGELTFLRRLPTTMIAAFKGRPDFLQTPVSRFDYIGFGNDLKDQPDLRAALSLSLDFKELQKILDARGIPGCPSLPAEWMDAPHCVGFNLDKAKRHFAKVPEEQRTRRLKLMFSMLGGDDIKKQAEWFQAQWKKNLGLTIDLEGAEQASYLERLRRNPPAIFRKGVGLERPTCLAAIETFAESGTENFIALADPAYDKIVQSLASGPKTARQSRKVCGQGVQYLLDHSLIIPLGRIHFTMLASPRFKGWQLNEMNQLDLASLQSR